MVQRILWRQPTVLCRVHEAHNPMTYALGAYAAHALSVAAALSRKRAKHHSVSIHMINAGKH